MKFVALLLIYPAGEPYLNNTQTYLQRFDTHRECVMYVESPKFLAWARKHGATRVGNESVVLCLPDTSTSGEKPA